MVRGEFLGVRLGELLVGVIQMSTLRLDEQGAGDSMTLLLVRWRTAADGRLRAR